MLRFAAAFECCWRIYQQRATDRSARCVKRLRLWPQVLLDTGNAEKRDQIRVVCVLRVLSISS